MSGSQPDEEIEGKLGWTAEEVQDVRDAMPDASSLNKPLTPDEGSSELGEFIEDERASDTAGDVAREMESAGLKEAIKELPERTKHVLTRRYGLDQRKPATLAELSDELGVSRERVRQIQIEAVLVLKEGEFGGALREVAA